LQFKICDGEHSSRLHVLARDRDLLMYRINAALFAASFRAVIYGAPGMCLRLELYEFGTWVRVLEKFGGIWDG
jgi:hypothetical protein